MDAVFAGGDVGVEGVKHAGPCEGALFVEGRGIEDAHGPVVEEGVVVIKVTERFHVAWWGANEGVYYKKY